MAQDNLEDASGLLSFVIHHPANQQSRMLEGRIRDSALGLLTKIETDLPPEVITKTLARGEGLRLEEIIEDLVPTLMSNVDGGMTQGRSPARKRDPDRLYQVIKREH